MNLDIRKIPVYCISISDDSRLRVEKMLNIHGFKDVRITPGVKERVKVAGVAKAHMAALQKALEECDGPFIIIEEDVDIFKIPKNIFVPEKADAIYLGISSWGLKNGHGENHSICFEKANGGLFKLWNMLAAHAILYVNHSYAQFLIDNIPTFLAMGTNQDKLRAETMKYWDVYATKVPVFYQRNRFKASTFLDLSKMVSKPMAYFYR